MAEALGNEAGGISGLRDLIRRDGRALEADLRSEYGVRLRDLYTGDLTWRELISYVDGLPPGSRVRTALNDGRTEPTPEAALLADDSVRSIIHIKTLHLGPEELLVAAKIAVAPTDSAADVARIIDAGPQT